MQFSYSVISDKYLYLPALGLLLIVTWALARSGNLMRMRWSDGAHGGGGWFRGSNAAVIAISTLVCVIAFAEIGATRRQIGYWRTTESLDRRLIALNPDNTEFHFDLGNALWDQGRLDEAHRELEIAVALDSTNVRALNNLALSAALRDEEARAIDLWKQTLRHHPGNYVARCNLAFYDLERSGRIEEALEQYARALRGQGFGCFEPDPGIGARDQERAAALIRHIVFGKSHGNSSPPDLIFPLMNSRGY